MGQTLTDEEKTAFMREHLQYEIEMLQWAAGILHEETVPFGLHNAAIEVFCLHARNLIEFLGKTARESRTHYASASHFTVSGYTPVRFDSALLERLNMHNSHLSYRRQSEGDKITGADLEIIGKYIETEMARFMESLHPNIRKVLYPVAADE